MKKSISNTYFLLPLGKCNRCNPNNINTGNRVTEVTVIFNNFYKVVIYAGNALLSFIAKRQYLIIFLQKSVFSVTSLQIKYLRCYFFCYRRYRIQLTKF